MSDRSPRPSLADAIAGLVVLPPLAYGFGFLMWVGPSRALYGQNVALALPATALLFPGVTYLGATALAILFGAMLGPERMWWPKTHSTRSTLLWAEIAFWIVVMLLAHVFAIGIVFGNPGELSWTAPVEEFYLALHIIVVGLAFRRLYGLVRGRWVPPTPDPREATHVTRLLRAVAVLTIVVTQVPLAVLFGVLGPNPAKNSWPVTIVNGGRRQAMYLLQQENTWVLGVDSLSWKLMRVPLQEGDVVVFEPHNQRLQRAASGRR